MPIMKAPMLPVVLLSGLACSTRLFADQLNPLWQRRSVFFANTRQHDNFIDMASAILQSAPKRFVLAGLSMGGYLAFEIMRQTPERVAALALFNTSARADSPESTEQRQRLIELAQQDKLQMATKMNFPRSVHPSRARDVALCDITIQMARETGRDAYIRQQQAIIHRVDSRPSLPLIQCPTIILVGAADQLTPPELSHEMAKLISQAELHIVPICGHLSTLEQPTVVNTLLLNWLDTLPE